MPFYRITHTAKQFIKASVIGGVAFSLAWLVIPKSYTSSASLLFPGSSGSAGTINSPTDKNQGISSPPSAPGAGASTDQPSLPLFQGVLSVPQPGTSPGTAGLILKSRKSVVKMIEEHNLNKIWHLPMDRCIDRFQRRFICKAGTSGDLLIYYTDRSPERSRQVVSSAIDMLTASVEELSLNPVERNLRLLREGLAQAQKDYQKAEAELVKFQRAHNGVPSDTELQTFSQIYETIQKDLINAELQAAADRTNAKEMGSVGRKMLKTAQDPTGSDKALLNILYQQMVNKESELASLKLKYTDKRPEVVQAQQAADVARRKVKEEVSRQFDGIKSGASPFTRDAVIAAVTSEAKAKGLRKAEREVRAKLAVLPAAQSKYLQLQSNLRDERLRLSQVRSEHVKAEWIARSRGPQFVVVDPPNSPQRPNGYGFREYLLIGLIIGPFLIIAKAGWQWIRQGIKMMSTGT